MVFTHQLVMDDAAAVTRQAEVERLIEPTERKPGGTTCIVQVDKGANRLLPVVVNFIHFTIHFTALKSIGEAAARA